MLPVITHESLLDMVGSLPEYKLDAVQLMRDGVVPETPEDYQRFSAATAQIVAYGEQCRNAVTALHGLAPVPAYDAALVDAFSL